MRSRMCDEELAGKREKAQSLVLNLENLEVFCLRMVHAKASTLYFASNTVLQTSSEMKKFI